MKLITAMVRPGKLDDVMRAATDAGCWSEVGAGVVAEARDRSSDQVSARQRGPHQARRSSHARGSV